MRIISKAMTVADDIISAMQELDVQRAALIKKAKTPCPPTCVHQKIYPIIVLTVLVIKTLPPVKKAYLNRTDL